MINIRNVDLNLLVAFDALYDTGNVSRAAERLSLTQSTVSGILNRLRELFADPLFVRTRHGVLPTPRADALRNPVKALLADVEALVQPETFDPATAELTVSISANDYMQLALIVPLVTALRERAPGIRVAVMPAYIAELADHLARGTVDLALSTPEFADPSLPRVHLYKERYTCIARDGHPHKGSDMSLEDFCRYDHVLVAPTGGSFSGPTDDALSLAGASRKVAVSLPNFQVMLETVRAADLLAVVPETLLSGSGSGLRTFVPPVPIPDFDVIACWHRRLEKSLVHRWVRDVLVQLAGEQAGPSDQ